MRTVKYLPRAVVLASVVLVTMCAAACNGPSSPAAPSSPAKAMVSADPVKTASEGAALATPPLPRPVTGPSVIGFPPRNEPNAFFQDLTALYRDVLGRTQSAPTYVDPEGENVWLTEYFRFYLNGCTHQEAMSRTLAEITSGGSQPVCGQETPNFPPRNLPNEFQGQLEATYRDALRRPQSLSYVDSEGANVWLAQYLRLRLTSCSHAVAQTKVFAEIRGGGVQPDCVDGAWSGTTNQGRPVSFNIANGLMTTLTYTVVGSGPACTVTMTTTWSSMLRQITGNSFSFTLSSFQHTMAFSGRFGSGGTASGTGQWSYVSALCPVSGATFTWTAARTSTAMESLDAAQPTRVTIDRR
jgi:hypothetical protein